tara:strand:+ start:1122 stop:1664 length:543 start_codon:yes stop_codon:yes gene_type:complete
MPFSPSLKSGLNSADLFGGGGKVGGFSPSDVLSGKAGKIDYNPFGGKTSSGFGIGKPGSFFNPSDESRASATRMAGLFGSILGGGKKSGTQLAGDAMANYINSQNQDKDKKGVGSIQSMGDDMFLYTPTREPDFAEFEGTYRKGAGGAIGGALMGGLKGFAMGGPVGAVVGAGAGALGGM